MGSSTIAIDFDGTFTADPSLWSEFIRIAGGAGHTVVCVTARTDTPKDSEYIRLMFATYECEVPVVFTAGQSKIVAMEERDTGVDIWIDNDPTALVNGSA